jgi:mono/diheme cytochrome c family protein
MRRSWPVLATIVLPAFSFACNDVTVEDVPQDVCWSGKRWIGGKRGSEHMYPGRDCVGCHRDNDGPELMVGGTIYDFVIFTQDDFESLQSGRDCFGTEGVRVMITTGDGAMLDPVTNEAGNFFVEGKQSDLVMPLQVRIEWGDGQVTPMGLRPSYGGCARCHGYREADETSEFTSADPEFVRGGIAYIGTTGAIDHAAEREALGLRSAHETGSPDAFDGDAFEYVEMPE